MRVIAWSQNLTAERAREVEAELAASKEALLAQGDFVSIHLVLSERTRGLIGADDLPTDRDLKRGREILAERRVRAVRGEA